ncbi:uncharacterized protein LOC128175426 [Crassostrea angulata]|uniref:uncharacterized protein LOC128175426 n=1 Tax=Magallana angulata TaxID=2784310 RepID=UPI0022B1D6CF|nr:uncharacterized protein LOC128175426 [Crassostrea angulata]
MKMCIGDDNLRQQIERMDKLSEIKRKIRAYQYLENLRNEVLADSLFRTEEKVERQQEQPVTNASRRTIIFAKIEAEILKKILTSNRNAVLVVKWMTIIKEHHQKMDSVHTELLKKVKEREDNTIADSLKKLENLNQNKWNATLDAWDKVKRNQILFSILVDQVRKIRTRRCPQMAGKMMKKLQDRHLVLEKLQEELMKRVNERENIRQAKKTIEEELLMEINRKEEMTKRRKMLHMELMSYHFERTIEEDTLFIPRKLFLTGVDTFKTVPKLDDALRDVNEGKDGPSASLSYEDQPQPLPQPKKGAKAKLTLKSRIKRIFGFR